MGGTVEPFIDETKYPVRSLDCRNQAIKPFRDRPELIDQVLTAIAITVHKAFDQLHTR
jgi:hypothetical protein